MKYEVVRKNLDAKITELVCESEVANNKKWKNRINREMATLIKAKVAVDKQIAQDVIVLRNKENTKIGCVLFRAGVEVYKCPSCEHFTTSSNKYCGECGQALKFNI